MSDYDGYYDDVLPVDIYSKQVWHWLQAETENCWKEDAHDQHFIGYRYDYNEDQTM